MTKRWFDWVRPPSGRAAGRRVLMAVVMAAVFAGASTAWAQGARALGDDRPIPATASPITDAVARLTQTPARSAPPPSPAWRNPVLMGTAIGGAGAALWQAGACRGYSSCNAGTAALVGAGVGAYTGLVVSAVRDARNGGPVSRGVKTALAAGAIAAVAGGWAACYGAGGCGGAS